MDPTMSPRTRLASRPRARVQLALPSFVAVVALAGAAAGCKGKAPPPSFDVKPQHDSATTIPGGAIMGKLRKQPFTVSDARYYIDHRMGYEKVTIYLSAGKAERACEPVAPDKAPSLWLRRKGNGGIPNGEERLVAGQPSEWELHYQVHEHEKWVGNGDASALVVLAPDAAGNRIKGSLSACFADGLESCVSGSFVAEMCPIVIDAQVRGREHPITSVSPRPPKAPAPAPQDAGADEPAASDAGTNDAGKGEQR